MSHNFSNLEFGQAEGFLVRPIKLHVLVGFNPEFCINFMSFYTCSWTEIQYFDVPNHMLSEFDETY